MEGREYELKTSDAVGPNGTQSPTGSPTIVRALADALMTAALREGIPDERFTYADYTTLSRAVISETERAVASARERCARMVQTWIGPDDPEWHVNKMHELAAAIRKGEE